MKNMWGLRSMPYIGPVVRAGTRDFCSKTKRTPNVPCAIKRAQSQATLLKSGAQIPQTYKAPLLRNVEALRSKQP